MDWFGTLRGRAGVVVHDSWLLYGTAGLAYGEVDHSSAMTALAVVHLRRSIWVISAQSNKDTKVGWTAGGGAEFLHDTHWLLRAEALFVDLGSETHSYNPGLSRHCRRGLRNGTISSGWRVSDSHTSSATQDAVWSR